MKLFEIIKEMIGIKRKQVRFERLSLQEKRMQTEILKNILKSLEERKI